MLTFAIKRILLAVLVAVTVAAVTFFLLRLSGDVAAAMAGEDATDEEIEEIRALYGLDQPLPLQFVAWAGRALSGELGTSVYFNKSVTKLIGERIGVTLVLGMSASALTFALSIPLGVLAATHPDTWVDRLALAFAVFGAAIPNFWFSLLMIFLFGVTLRWLPVSGSNSAVHFILPVIVLGLSGMPSSLRLTRAGMLEVLTSDYIRTARAKGLRTASILFKHALRNAIIPVISLAAVQLGSKLNGSVVVETIFSLRGLGFLTYQSITRLDVPVVQAALLLFALFYVVLTLLADLLNGFLDPRIRLG